MRAHLASWLAAALLSQFLFPAGARASEAGSLLELPVPESPVVVVRVLVQAGSIDDPQGKEGVCRLTMAAAAHGGTAEWTKTQVADHFYPMDAAIDLFVDRETAVFTGRVRREDLAEFIPIFLDLIFRPRFDPDDFRQARENALSALESDLLGGDDERLGKEGLQAILFEGTPCAHPTLGTEKGLEAITTADLRSFHAAAMTKDRVQVGIAGSYPPEIAKRIRSELSSLPDHGNAWQARRSALLQTLRAGSGVPAPPQRGTAPPGRPADDGVLSQPAVGLDILLVEKPAQATAISLGFVHEVRRGDPDYWPLYLALNAFGEHRTFQGRLMREMRSQRGLNYGDYAYLEHFEQDGWSRQVRPGMWRSVPYFSIWIRPVQPANGVFALRMAVWELRRLVDAGLSESEFETTREHLRNLSQLWRQTLVRRVGLAMDDAHFGEEDGIRSLEQALAGMTREQVNDALRRRLYGRDLHVAMVCADADSIRTLLTRGDPTPIVYSGGDAPEEIRAVDREIAALPLTVKAVRIEQATEIFRGGARED